MQSVGICNVRLWLPDSKMPATHQICTVDARYNEPTKLPMSVRYSEILLQSVCAYAIITGSRYILPVSHV